MLKVENLSFESKGQKILDTINLEIQQQDFITISGPSGSGKSTLLKIIASLLSPTEGKIIFEGKDIAQMNAALYRREVSYCFQQPTLFGDTVLDNLKFPFEVRDCEIDEKKMHDLLEAVDLSENYLTKSIHEISGGERSRVAMIRNLIFAPKVLLLDEVTTGLDELSKSIVHQLIQKVNQQGIAILQVTHDQEEIALGEKIIKISGGRVLNESANI